jgi:hypothetical protein
VNASGRASAHGRYAYLQFGFGAAVLSLRCDNDTDDTIAASVDAWPGCQPVVEVGAEMMFVGFPLCARERSGSQSRSAATFGRRAVAVRS